MWLLALLKYNIQRECIKEKFSSLHYAFMDFLSDNSGKLYIFAIYKKNLDFY